MAVRIQVQLTDSTTRHVKKDQQRITRETQVVLMPEFNAPKFKETKAAVAGSNASSAATAVAGASPEQTTPAAPHTPAVEESAALGAAAVAEIQWLWGQGKAETMHPFWAVRRLTADQLDSEQKACIKRNKTAVAGKNEKVPGFNCEFQEHVQSACMICGVGRAVANCTRLIKVPTITNSTALAPGDELILPLIIEAKETTTPKKRTWRDVDKEEASERKRRETQGRPGRDLGNADRGLTGRLRKFA